MTLVALAEEIATHAHAGQFRRDGVTPYIEHPRAVVRRLEGSSEEVLATAWLHDVLEDTKVTEEALREAGIPESVITAVIFLTRTPGIPYLDFIVGNNWIKGVVDNEIATVVKIADMQCNLADSPTVHQVKKYTEGLRLLGMGTEQSGLVNPSSPQEIRERCGWTENQYIEILHDFIDLSSAGANLTHYLKQEAHKQGFKV